MTMPDSEHLQQQQEHIRVDSHNAQDTMQLPEEESDEVSVLLVMFLKYQCNIMHGQTFNRERGVEIANFNARCMHDMEIMIGSY